MLISILSLIYIAMVFDDVLPWGSLPWGSLHECIPSPILHGTYDHIATAPVMGLCGLSICAILA